MRLIEGRTKLNVPKLKEDKFPPSSDEVFYNPKMEANRDLTVAMVDLVKPSTYFDAHAATGARAVRIKNEVKKVKIICNDISKKAIDFIKQNIKINDLNGIKIYNKDSNLVLQKNSFGFIDLDPFGSPVPFLENSIVSLQKNGFLAITATDTAPLCGSQIKACMRRYGARSLRTPYHKELGARILVGKVIRDGLQQDKALFPQLTYFDSHYFRAFFKMNKGAKVSNKFLDKIGFIQHCFKCGNRSLKHGLTPYLKKKCECGGKFKNTGPLFLGKIQKPDLIKDLKEKIKNKELNKKKELIKLLNALKDESGAPPTFYNIHKVSEKLSKSAPKTNELLKKLRDQGYLARKTHFDELGFKTDADIEEIKEIFNSLV